MVGALDWFFLFFLLSLALSLMVILVMLYAVQGV